MAARCGPAHSWATVTTPKMSPIRPKRSARSIHHIFWYRVKKAVASPQTFLNWIIGFLSSWTWKRMGRGTIRFLFRRVLGNRSKIIPPPPARRKAKSWGFAALPAPRPLPYPPFFRKLGLLQNLWEKNCGQDHLRNFRLAGRPGGGFHLRQREDRRGRHLPAPPKQWGGLPGRPGGGRLPLPFRGIHAADGPGPGGPRHQNLSLPRGHPHAGRFP